VYAGHFDFSVAMLQRVPALYTGLECADLLATVRDASWLAATVNTAAGRQVNEQVRDSLTAIVRDPALTTQLWHRIQPHLPASMSAEWGSVRQVVRPVGLYEPLRIYRYEVGHHFGLHSDQSYARDHLRSLLTLMVYLDDDFDGGETTFPDQHETVVPVTGDALWFQHAVLHAGTKVTRGTKHVLRTDVLFAV
jgi:predicted 2-oxoglutarate/Fe(II)-dependent dioxygenase YbiX